jgi:type I restriction enzyme S subunit
MKPDGWRSTTLKDVAPGESGLQTGPFGAQLHASDYTATGVPVVMPKDLDGGRINTRSIARVPEAIAASLDRHRVRAGDILFGRRGDIGRCGLVVEDERGWLCGTGCLRARPDPRLADALFLVQLFTWETSVKWLTENAVGQTMLNLNTNILGALPLCLPPLAEQRKIATILSSVDDAIAATQAVIDHLGVVKKAMMAELLTRGLPGRHTRFKHTEIGEVPEDWEVVPLDAVAVVQTGIAKGKAVERGVELPYLRVANVQDGHVDLAEMKTILVEETQVERYRLRVGDVLFTEGGDADKLGRGCVWHGQVDPCLHQNHVFAVRSNAARLLPQFLAYWAASPRGKEYFLDCAKQTTNLASINSTQLKAFPVPVVPSDEQVAIVALLSLADARLEAERRESDGLQALKAALMSVLLTGEVRVTPDDEAAA